MVYKAALLGVSIVTGAAAAGPAGSTGKPSLIAFARWERGPTAAIYTVDPTGRGLHRLSKDSGAIDAFPSWSPDGRKIVFQRSVGGRSYEIWVMNADGSGMRRVARDGSTPSWAPDGRAIVFSSGALQVVGIDGGGRHRIAPSGYCSRWSPDGKSLAFTSGAGLYVMHADGGGRRRLAQGGICPAWSPDGRRIAYTLGKQGGSERVPIWVMNADGTGKHLVRALSEEDGNVDWSPDGRKIVFTYRSDLYVMQADGTGVAKITHGPGGDYTLSWQRSHV
jgi:Tol biopolymer transport system component